MIGCGPADLVERGDRDWWEGPVLEGDEVDGGGLDQEGLVFREVEDGEASGLDVVVDSHFPYDSTERFHDTRITTFRFSTWLLLQQDRHLIHHLYPSVPWYRYRAVFGEVRPLLVANGAALEGRDAHPNRPIRLRRTA